MAGEWFPVDVALDTKPEVQELVDLTSEPVEVVVFRLLKLWGWAQLNTADGTFRATPARLGRICGGDDQFWLAVAHVGWIEFDGETASIPKWESRFSGAAKTRTLKNRRQSRYRGAPVDGVVALVSRPSGAPVDAPVDAGVALASRPRGAQAPRERLPHNKTGQDRTGEEEKHTTHTGGGSPASLGWAATEWESFVLAWNRTARAKPWTPLLAPEGWVDHAASPGWLAKAREAMARLPTCEFFRDPVAVTRFFGYVDRILAGEFDTAKQDGREQNHQRRRQPTGGNL